MCVIVSGVVQLSVCDQVSVSGLSILSISCGEVAEFIIVYSQNSSLFKSTEHSGAIYLHLLARITHYAY